jgi:hypothetical protein
MNDMMWYRSALGRSLRLSGAGLTPLQRLRECSPLLEIRNRTLTLIKREIILGVEIIF